LRERKDDIPLLVKHFAKVFSDENNRPQKQFSDHALAALMAYDWPGNVRELKNVVERLVIMTDDATIADAGLSPGARGAPTKPGDKTLNLLVEDYEKALIQTELTKSGWNISQAAAKLGMNRANLHRKMRRYGIVREGGQQGEGHLKLD
jgi:two-component system nitrogen regulation response regulator NtrX